MADLSSTQRVHSELEIWFDQCIAEFFRALHTRTYPSSSCGEIFGIKMAIMQPYTNSPVYMPIGKLVYEVWRALYFSGMIDPASLKRAILQRRLPHYFQQKVRSFRSSDSSVEQLRHRGFEEILWNHVLLNEMAYDNSPFAHAM